AVGGVQVLVAGGSEAREVVGATGEPGLGGGDSAGGADGFEPGSAAGNDLSCAGGVVVDAEAVDTVGEVGGGEVDVPVALANGSAVGEDDVEEVDGFLVGDDVCFIAEVDA